MEIQNVIFNFWLFKTLKREVAIAWRQAVLVLSSKTPKLSHLTHFIKINVSFLQWDDSYSATLAFCSAWTFEEWPTSRQKENTNTSDTYAQYKAVTGYFVFNQH